MILEDLRSIPRFGFGMMRLPVLNGDNETIDIPQVCQMVDDFLAKGFYYFDTAYPYHNGASERAVKEVLVKRYPRESFLLADKMPPWFIKKKEDVKTIFETQLERTGAEYFDLYLLHNMEKDLLPVFEENDCFEFCKKMKEEGKIRHLGMSFHDDPELLDRILTDHPEIEFVQLQINYLDWENPVVCSRANYEVCEKHGLPVIVMEPVKGGTLANLPEEAEKLLKEANPDRSSASWALRFVLSLDKVMVCLSGMSNREQMEDNLNTASQLEALSEKERETLDEVIKLMVSKPSISCTACRYCVDGCPKGIVIPELFRAMNSWLMYHEMNRAKGYYNGSLVKGSPAGACVQCGQCEQHCPQHLEIRELLAQISEIFDK